jgi:hypothetical protein
MFRAFQGDEWEFPIVGEQARKLFPTPRRRLSSDARKAARTANVDVRRPPEHRRFVPPYTPTFRSPVDVYVDVYVPAPVPSSQVHFSHTTTHRLIFGGSLYGRVGETDAAIVQ